MTTNSYLTADPANITQVQQQVQETISKRNALQERISIAENNLLKLEDRFSKSQGFLGKLFSKKESVENISNEIDETTQEVNSLKNELESLSVNVDGFYTSIKEDDFNTMLAQFQQVITSNKVWNVIAQQNSPGRSAATSTIDRKEVSLSIADLDFIQSKCKALTFKNLNGPDLFIYPGFILQSFSNGDISLLATKELTFTFRSQKFIEPKASIPPDSKIIDMAWDKVNKDGTPDLRYSNNFQTPIVRYGVMDFSFKNGVNATYYISNYEVAATFAINFQQVVLGLAATENNITGSVNPEFSRQYFDLLTDFTTEVTNITNSLGEDKTLTEKIGASLGGYSMKEFMGYCVTYDLCQVAKLLNDGDYGKNPLATAGLILLASKVMPGMEDPFNGDYDKTALAYSKGILIKLSKTIVDIGNNNNPLKINSPGNDDSSQKLINSLCLTKVLKAFGDPLFNKYAAVLYHFANIIAKADNQISKEEEEKLKDIYQVTSNPIPEQKGNTIVNTGMDEPIENILAELDALTGLEGVKTEIKTLINFVKVQKARESSGLKSSLISYHMVFTGNPGTGKTTVARIVAKIYKALGILSQGQLVETDRSGLIAEYVGQTAIKVDKTVDSALNGVLFIDEAYSLAGNSENDFGKEAVATLIKRMEDDRDKLVIIMAGYTTEMNEFIETNPGFKSRINRYIEFTDYAPADLLSIYEGECSKLEYILTDDAKVKLLACFTKAYAERDKFFGNGRFARNVFEKALENQANRIAGIPSLTKEILTTITGDDIT